MHISPSTLDESLGRTLEPHGHGGGMDEHATKAVGRWGEALTARVLRESGDFSSVDWVNEESEQGLPYDIKTTWLEQEENGAQTRVTFVEVKSTISADKQLFELSLAELDFMRRAGRAYELFRVWGAGSASARVARLREPAAHLASGKLALFASPSMVGRAGHVVAREAGGEEPGNEASGAMNKRQRLE